MFSELATLQEEIVHTTHQLPSRHHSKRVILEDSEEDVELDVLERQTTDLDAVCEAVHKLLSKNVNPPPRRKSVLKTPLMCHSSICSSCQISHVLPQ